MANKIILKKSSVASKVPLATDLDIGEIAVNLADQKLYSKNASGTVILVGTGTATGTVTSVGMTVPTGLTVSGFPVTTSGTLAVTLTAGYSIPTTTSQTNWDSAYTQRLQWDGGSTNLVAATGRTSLGGTTVGQNFFTLTNPAAITFPRINADNTVSALDAATFRTAISAGTVTGVTATSPVASSGGTAPVISLASGYGDTQNPFASKTANYVFAAPNGVAGAPTFRAIVAADIPTLNQNTTGSAATLTTTRTLWGQNFNGSANVTGALSSVTTMSMSGQLTSTLATGTSPFSVTSTTINTNLNADLLDGQHGSYYAPIASPTLTGTPAAPTAAAGTNTTQLATTAFVNSEIANDAFLKAAGGSIVETVATISANYSITSGSNGLSAGPITIATGVTVTIPTGSNWVIV